MCHKRVEYTLLTCFDVRGEYLGARVCGAHVMLGGNGYWQLGWMPQPSSARPYRDSEVMDYVSSHLLLLPASLSLQTLECGTLRAVLLRELHCEYSYSCFLVSRVSLFVAWFSPSLLVLDWVPSAEICRVVLRGVPEASVSWLTIQRRWTTELSGLLGSTMPGGLTSPLDSKTRVSVTLGPPERLPSHSGLPSHTWHRR